MATKAAPAAAASTAAAGEMTENIAYMTLMHELKAAFPNLSDEAVKQCVLEVSIHSSYLVDTTCGVLFSEGQLVIRAISTHFKVIVKMPSERRQNFLS